MTSRNTTARGADNRAQIEVQTLYRHPDGGTVWVAHRGKTAKIGVAEGCGDEGDCAALYIGPIGLKCLALKLLDVATEMGAAQ